MARARGAVSWHRGSAAWVPPDRAGRGGLMSAVSVTYQAASGLRTPRRSDRVPAVQPVPTVDGVTKQCSHRRVGPPYLRCVGPGSPGWSGQRAVVGGELAYALFEGGVLGGDPLDRILCPFGFRLRMRPKSSPMRVRWVRISVWANLSASSALRARSRQVASCGSSASVSSRIRWSPPSPVAPATAVFASGASWRSSIMSAGVKRTQTVSEARREPATQRPRTRFLQHTCGTAMRYVARLSYGCHIGVGPARSAGDPGRYPDRVGPGSR